MRSRVRALGHPVHPMVIAVVLEVIAVLAGGVAAWLGGELVDRLGIGVDENAHPDASSSLAR